MGFILTAGFFLYLGQWYSFGDFGDDEEIQLLIWGIIIDYYVIRIL